MIWFIRLGMFLAGILIMYIEGQHQPSPGVGFAIAMCLILGIPFTFKETESCGG